MRSEFLWGLSILGLAFTLINPFLSALHCFHALFERGHQINMLTTMSRIFKFGIRNRCGIQVDPTKLIERVKENSGEQSETGERLYTGLHQVTETEVLTPEEVKRVILAAKPGLYRTIIQTAIYTGARISEILALRWEDLNLDRGVIQIRRSLSIARVKGEANQEKIRWFDPKTKSG